MNRQWILLRRWAPHWRTSTTSVQNSKSGESNPIGEISIQFGLIDDLTVQIVNYLTQGQNIYNAVYATVSPFNQGQQPEDNLDTTYAPPFWFVGNGTLTITSGISNTGTIAQQASYSLSSGPMALYESRLAEQKVIPILPTLGISSS